MTKIVGRKEAGIVGNVGKVFVIVVVSMVLAIVASPSSGSFAEFRRQFEVRFLYGGIDSRRWLVDAEGGLHALNGAEVSNYDLKEANYTYILMIVIRCHRKTIRIRTTVQIWHQPYRTIGKIFCTVYGRIVTVVSVMVWCTSLRDTQHAVFYNWRKCLEIGSELPLSNGQSSATQSRLDYVQGFAVPAGRSKLAR